jgi:hypothetical protein
MLLKLPLQNEQMIGLGKIIFEKVLGFKIRAFEAIKSQDEEEIKCFTDIFQTFCEYNFSQIIDENRLDLIEIMAELSKNASVERK